MPAGPRDIHRTRRACLRPIPHSPFLAHIRRASRALSASLNRLSSYYFLFTSHPTMDPARSAYAGEGIAHRPEITAAETRCARLNISIWHQASVPYTQTENRIPHVRYGTSLSLHAHLAYRVLFYFISILHTCICIYGKTRQFRDTPIAKNGES